MTVSPQEFLQALGRVSIIAKETDYNTADLDFADNISLIISATLLHLSGGIEMKIIEPSVELMRDFDGAEVMKFIERCGRICYQSEKNITADSAEKFVRNLIKRGHESVLEHFSATFKIICDRGVMAELTRHRLASFSVESTRYNAYKVLKKLYNLKF